MCPMSTRFLKKRRSSYKGHTGDTLAPTADEGRGRPRESGMSRQQAMIPGCPNGATQQVEDLLRLTESIGESRQAGELKHLSSPKRRKQISDSLSSGERKGTSLNLPRAIACRRCVEGVVGPPASAAAWHRVKNSQVSRTSWEGGPEQVIAL